MVTGPSLMQTPSCGTTTRWYVPGASVPLQVVVPPPAKAGSTTNVMATSAPRPSMNPSLLICLLSPRMSPAAVRRAAECSRYRTLGRPDAVHDPAPPVGHQEAAPVVDEQRERVHETGRERGH